MVFNLEQENYRRLRDIVSERTRRLIVWCGSGLSIPAGLPDWSGLRRSLSSELRRKAATYRPKDRPKAEDEIQRIAREKNPWVAFQRLKLSLGHTSFMQAIREALSPAVSSSVPEAYTWVWRLRPAGVLNLNLDKLATRAFYEVSGPKVLSEFDTNAVGDHTHVLKGLNPFVYNLHGVHENSSSWVLTIEDLKTLLANKAYENFVDSAISSSTLLFVGINVEDLAVGGHLSRLANLGIRTGPHFWISSHDDRETDRWAENSGILVVRYSPLDSSHGELAEVFKNLLRYVPPDEIGEAPPVIVTALPNADRPTHTSVLPTPAELARQDAESIRRLLNAKAAELLAVESPESFKRFEAFSKQYDESIHRAWYVSTQGAANNILGYRLQEEIARGAFGRVFRALADDGSTVAVKLLHNEMRENRDLLLAFRRGVRSMSILRARGVDGVVAYREGSEIPAIVVMDWVDGANLKDAVEAGRLDSWEAQLTVARGIVHVIAAAHATPERVLHRDIRPANVMLEGFWTTESWRVVVLDFDLSWHRGAYEKTVVHGSSAAGYLAPEQISKLNNVSARHAAVDSFGLGMTLYFVLSKNEPVPAQHLHSTWAASVNAAARRLSACTWRSLPRRYGRLILRATSDLQAARLDIAQIASELDRLNDSLTEPQSLRAADLLAEEVAARTDAVSDYEWDQDAASAKVARPSGLKCEIRGDESRSRIIVTIVWSRTGAEDRRRVGRWIPEAAKNAVGALQSAGWEMEENSVEKEGLLIQANSGVEDLKRTFEQHILGVDRAMGFLRFE